MSSTRNCVLSIGASLLAGAALGGIVNRSVKPPTTPLGNSEYRQTNSAPTPETPAEAPSTASSKAKEDPVLPNASDTQNFGSLDFEKQKAALQRIQAKFSKSQDTPPSIQLWIARLASQLSADQTVALLESGFEEKGNNALSRTALSERLAAIDPQRALDLAKKLEDPQLAGCAIASLAVQDGALALRAAAALDEKQRSKALETLRSESLTKIGGSFDEMTKVLKENPSFTQSSMRGWGGIQPLLGTALAQSALADPATALKQVQDLSSELESILPPPPEDPTGGRDGRRGRRSGGQRGPTPITGIVEGALSEMRSTAPEAASSFFDSLSEKERSPWMASREAATRFQTGGIESAVSFSEKQTDDETLRSAALGTWWSLVQKDPATASSWIDSLPSGAFRQGVLTAVMLNAWNQSNSWGSQQTAIDAGLQLSSKAAQLDYFTNMMNDRHGPPKRTELINDLPISEADKIELIRRVAPITPPSPPANQ